MAKSEYSAENEEKFKETAEPWWRRCCPNNRPKKEDEDESDGVEPEPWWSCCCLNNRCKKGEDESGEVEPEPWWRYCCPKKRPRKEYEDESGEVEPVPWWSCCCPKTRPKTEDEDGLSEVESDTWWRCCHRRKPNASISLKERTLSVICAEDKLKELKRLSESTEHATNIETRHLPLTFVPNYIINEIIVHSFEEVPHVKTSKIVLLIADVCEFTSLCENYCANGVIGIEKFINILNGFMCGLAAMFLERGGDILNFAGDAFFVQWVKEGSEDIEKIVAEAFKCAIALQTHQFLKTKNLGGALQIKIGISMGETSTWTFGSDNFFIFATAGPCVLQVHKAESFCSSGDIVVDKDIHKILKNMKVIKFTSVPLNNGYVKITEYPSEESDKEPAPNRLQLFDKCDDKNISVARTFLVPPIRGLKSFDELRHLSELAMVTVLFISLSVNVTEPTLLDKPFHIILKSCKGYRGVLNKMNMFDKGCTFLVVFGLPGLKHANDAARGIRCAHDIVGKLDEIGIIATVGITSGMCFCGLVGHPQRQEYTVIGNRVNMAARMMVVYQDERIALNNEAYHLSRDELGDHNFTELPIRKMRGIDSGGSIYAYRKQRSRKVSAVSFEFLEQINLQGSDRDKAKIKRCIKAMGDDKERESIKKNSLLPVLLIKGLNSSGKSYLMYFAIDAAIALNYKFAACCSISSFSEEPFYVITRLIRRMLKMTMNESCFTRENLIMSILDTSNYPDLYLLNHLFDSEFPVPEAVVGNWDHRNDKIAKLFKLMIHKLCEDTPTLFAIHNADYMDEQSWDVLHQLLEEEKLLVALSLSPAFKETNEAQTSLLLKAYLHHNTQTIQESLFASYICWILHVEAVHVQIILYLMGITGGQTLILKEICSSSEINQIAKIVPKGSIPEARMQEEFHVERFQVLNYAKPMVCDLKHEVTPNLQRAMILTNVQDSVKKTLSILTLQERLLLKRATVLGQDFDLHTLECISKGIERGEVLQMIHNLLSNNVFVTVCSLLNTIEPTGSMPTVSVQRRSTCFCFCVYLNSQMSGKKSPFFPIGPYHRLKFRSQEFRNRMLSHMTQDQIYNLRVEVAGNLESEGSKCSSCKNRRIASYKKKNVRNYSVISSKCTCLELRPTLYSEISALYSTLGMLFLPVYFKKKAAQAANDINHPIRALYYVQYAKRLMPQYWLMSEKEKLEEEDYFDPLVLDASLKKTTAIAFLLLGDTYTAASYAYQGAELMGMHAVCFHGVFNAHEFKRILPKFVILHAEFLTKLIGVLAKAYLTAHTYNLARNLLQIEYHALTQLPIDFIHVLKHMTMMYKLNYLINRKAKLKNLQKNILKLCHDRLTRFNLIVDLREIVSVADMYATLLEVNVGLANIAGAEAIENEAYRILSWINFRGKLALIRVFAFHLSYYANDFVKCSEIVIELGNMSDASERRTPRALYICCLALFLMKSLIGMEKPEIQLNFDKCNEFASQWGDESSRMMTKDLQFYVSVVLADWCLYSDKNSAWLGGKDAFGDCFEVATTLSDSIAKSTHNFWTISAILKFLQLQYKLEIKKDVRGFEDYTMNKDTLRKELKYLKPRIKKNYPLFMEDYRKLASHVPYEKPNCFE